MTFKKAKVIVSWIGNCLTLDPPDFDLWHPIGISEPTMSDIWAERQKPWVLLGVNPQNNKNSSSYRNGQFRVGYWSSLPILNSHIFSRWGFSGSILANSDDNTEERYGSIKCHQVKSNWIHRVFKNRLSTSCLP